jgi:hypothetical protein
VLAQADAQVIILNWKPMFATALLTTALVPIVSATDAGYVCTPASDPGVKTLPTSPITYVKEYRIGNAVYVELWQESNGVAGLQRDASWNCGGAADALIAATCSGCALNL